MEKTTRNLMCACSIMQCLSAHIFLQKCLWLNADMLPKSSSKMMKIMKKRRCIHEVLSYLCQENLLFPMQNETQAMSTPESAAWLQQRCPYMEKLKILSSGIGNRKGNKSYYHHINTQIIILRSGWNLLADIWTDCIDAGLQCLPCPIKTSRATLN